MLNSSLAVYAYIRATGARLGLCKPVAVSRQLLVEPVQPQAFDRVADRVVTGTVRRPPQQVLGQEVLPKACQYIQSLR